MRALYICRSISQTRMVHQVARQLPQFEAYFTPDYEKAATDTLASL